jgi:predicted AAA+ superfamily ATPase
MASNLDRVNKGLELLRKGLLPFVEREMKLEYKKNWESEAIDSFPINHHARNLMVEEWDVQALLSIMLKQWNKVFGKTLGHQERAWISELMELRKRAAHQNSTNVFDTDDAFRALDNVERVLSAISSPEVEEADLQKGELLRIRYEESSRKKAKKIEAKLVESSLSSGLKPWRQVIEPHPDVASGRFQQAEFAADLWSVYQDGKNAGEYGNPIDFFNRTFFTQGIRKLLSNALYRLNGKGGDPIINLQTNFGGGKTHSLLALHHLCSGENFSSVRDLEHFFSEMAGLRPPKKVNKAIIVGNRISPGIRHPKPDGSVVNTIWGEVAWQLGKEEGYKIVQESDEKGTNPGGDLVKLLKRFSPCIILIDEWVAYVRQLHENNDLNAGSYGTHMSFAQALCEAAKSVPEALVVISLPASDIEMGGERGRSAAAELGNIIGRTEIPWSAATTEESFEIVTRRLFSPIIAKDNFANRDASARAFGDFYRGNKTDFPSEAHSSDYEKRIRDFYPIHPELFDRLAKDWAEIDKFQKTRGILRLMAKIIHFLWDNNDQGPIILPANVPMDDLEIQGELMRYLDEPWRAVIRKDVDGANSLPKEIDNDFPNLGRYSATRKVARTLFFGSAPTFNAAHKGIDELRLKLGSVLPGETTATYTDALRHLTDKATYVYHQNQHYWYSTQNNVNRTAEERAAHISIGDVEQEIQIKLTQYLTGTKGLLSRVHIMPQTTNEIPDDMEMKLVVLGIENAHTPRIEDSLAYVEARNILNTKGTSQRVYRNTLIFLAPDKTRLDELKVAVRNYLAWKSIVGDKAILNLDVFQSNQADGKVRTGAETIKLRLPETFIWILTPHQDIGSSTVTWDESKMNGSIQDSYISRITKKLFTQSQLYNDFASTELRMNLDNVPLWRGDHVPIKQLVEDFAKYLYLPKLTSSELLRGAIQSGINIPAWHKDTFAYAESYDEDNNRYRGLAVGHQAGVSLNGNGLVVKSDVAFSQLEQDRADQEKKLKDGPGTTPYQIDTGNRKENITEPVSAKAVKTRFYGDVDIDAVRFYRDAEGIEKEIIKHLVSLKGTAVKISIHIEADNKDGFSADIERTIKENSKTLKFGSAEFE